MHEHCCHDVAPLTTIVLAIGDSRLSGPKKVVPTVWRWWQIYQLVESHPPLVSCHRSVHNITAITTPTTTTPSSPCRSMVTISSAIHVIYVVHVVSMTDCHCCNIQIVKHLKKRPKTKVHVLCRPRAGDFVYTEAEFEVSSASMDGD